MSRLYLPNSMSLISRLLCLLVLIPVSITACQAGNEELLTTATTKNIKLVLHKQQGVCAIRFAQSSATISLNIPWPCGFVRAGNKPIAQTHHYDGVGQVFIIAGPPVNKNDYPSDAGVNPSYVCSNKGQAVIVKNKAIIKREAQEIPLGFCHLLGFDEKDYYGYAYPVK